MPQCSPEDNTAHRFVNAIHDSGTDGIYNHTPGKVKELCRFCAGHILEDTHTIGRTKGWHK